MILGVDEHIWSYVFTNLIHDSGRGPKNDPTFRTRDILRAVAAKIFGTSASTDHRDRRPGQTLTTWRREFLGHVDTAGAETVSTTGSPAQDGTPTHGPGAGDIAGHAPRPLQRARVPVKSWGFPHRRSSRRSRVRATPRCLQRRAVPRQ